MHGLLLAVLVQVAGVEGLCKVGAQVVGGACLRPAGSGFRCLAVMHDHAHAETPAGLVHGLLLAVLVQVAGVEGLWKVSAPGCGRCLPAPSWLRLK